MNVRRWWWWVFLAVFYCQSCVLLHWVFLSLCTVEGFSIQDCQFVEQFSKYGNVPLVPGESLVRISLISQTWGGGRGGCVGVSVVWLLAGHQTDQYPTPSLVDTSHHPHHRPLTTQLGYFLREGRTLPLLPHSRESFHYNFYVGLQCLGGDSDGDGHSEVTEPLPPRPACFRPIFRVTGPDGTHWLEIVEHFGRQTGRLSN